MDIFNYNPRKSHLVHVGNRPLGGDSPLRLQSMTTCHTTDTEGCVKQAERIFRVGADYVRLTTQGTREAENLRNIKAGLLKDGFDGPLVADVHFNPAVADVAATIVEKVRINPGNYVDPARRFKHIDYTDEEYAEELRRLEDRFKKLLAICREHGTALRIGVNHGSLSDRIMSRYGDTPEGIVESCMEFLRICMKENFLDVVVSIKASNTVIMVRSVRLLCREMEKEGMDFPLHLGVTEAGEGEDGRIKSAVGIGALLSDGIGDTIRVSLSEEPEREIPVAYEIADYVTSTRGGHERIPGVQAEEFDYLNPSRRPTVPVGNIGGTNLPVVVSARPEGNKDFVEGAIPDYIYCGASLPGKNSRREGVGYIVNADGWRGEDGTYPIFTPFNLFAVGMNPAKMKFLLLDYLSLNDEVRACLRHHPEMVVIARTNHQNPTGELRALIHELWKERISTPVVACLSYELGEDSRESFQLRAAADLGGLMVDRIIDGVMLCPEKPKGKRSISPAFADQTAFAILQAGRMRMTKTEYISCPGCGRTMYDLQTTIARIKKATAHLKGLKIGIMGCIVNGPGEMADADYGYVGAGPKRVSLYRGKICVEKNIPEEDAVSHLLALIDGDRKAKEGN